VLPPPQAYWGSLQTPELDLRGPTCKGKEGREREGEVRGRKGPKGR